MTFLIKNLLTINIIIITLCGKSLNGDLNILIFHTGCVHAKYDEEFDPSSKKSYGGIDRFAYLIKSARKQHEAGKGPVVLYIEPGDFFIGSIWYSIHSYYGAAKVLNQLKPDAFNIGANEFKVELDALTNFSKLVKFPLISTNTVVNDKVELKKIIKSSIVKTINGVKVGIVGYLTPDFSLWGENPDVEAIDIAPVISKECRRLRFEEDVKVIIAMSNGNLETDRMIAYTVDYIDVIIGSGASTFLWNGVPPDKETPEDSYPAKVTRSDGSLVLILRAYQYIKYIGKINLQFKKDGKLKSFFGTPILLDKSIPRDPQMSELLDELRKDVTTADQKILSASSVVLDSTNCKYEECNFGNMVADAIVEHRATQYRGSGWTDAAIVLLNSGAIAADINSPQKGKKIFYGDVLRALPFTGMLYIVEIKGSDLLFVLEISTNSFTKGSRTEQLHTAGIKVMFHLESPFGQRIKLIKIRCSDCDVPKYLPLVPDKRYKVIVTTYLLSGGAGYTIIRDICWNPIPFGESAANVTIQYLEKVDYVIAEAGGRLLHYNNRLDKTSQISFGSSFSLDCCCFLLMLISLVTS